MQVLLKEKIHRQISGKSPRVSKQEYFFAKKVGEAVACYDLIKDGDRILIGISGGKDSMSLLKVLRYMQRRFKGHFDIMVCYVDMGMDDVRRVGIEGYFKANGCEYIIEEAKIWQAADTTKINCFWCSFNRRKKLFETAARLGYNKIALGHHKDDIAETFLLNVFFHGEISTMMPRQPLFEGKMEIIRPLALCEEKFIIDYAKRAGFPQFEDACPNSAISKRKMMKDILRSLAKENPDVKTNIFRCMQRIKKEYILQ